MGHDLGGIDRADTNAGVAWQRPWEEYGTLQPDFGNYGGTVASPFFSVSSTQRTYVRESAIIA